MNANEKLIALVNQMPQADARRILGTVDKEAVEKALGEILQGGKENVAGVVDLLVETGKGDDGKARYALHALAVEVCKRKDAAHRQMFNTALAGTLGSDRPKEVQAFVIRQLQIAGTKEATPALGKLLLDDELCEPASQALLAIKEGAVEQFRNVVLTRATAKQALPVVQALGVLRETKSAGEIRKLIDAKDRDLRLTALWALANIGDAESADLLLKAAEQATGSERAKATHACLLLAENLAAADKKKEAGRIYTQLMETRTDPAERHIKEAAMKGLLATGGSRRLSN
jgi:HEAT repeat protein